MLETQTQSFTPNHSLMLPWTKEARSQKQAPYAEPFVAHFKKDGKQLHYIGTLHEHGVESPTFKTVKQVFETKKPDFIIFEGAPSDMDVTDPKYIQYMEREAAANFPTGEGGYITSLAHQNGVPFIGGEPNKKEVYEALKKQGYTALDMRGLEVLSWMPRWTKWEGIKGKEALEAKIREQQSTTDLNDLFPNEKRFTLETFKQWYDARDPQHKPLEELTNDDIGPFEGPGANYIHRLNAAINAIRNTNLDKQIAKALNEHDNVLVVYGSGHFFQSRLVYEDMLGKPEYEQLFAPIANNPESLNAGKMESPKESPSRWETFVASVKALFVQQPPNENGASQISPSQSPPFNINYRDDFAATELQRRSPDQLVLSSNPARLPTR